MQNRLQYRFIVFLLASLCLALALGGCATSRNRHNAASVVDFLYPDTKNPVVKPGIPVLTLPLRVGIAFVPSSGYGNAALTEKKKMDLMQQVADHFKKYPYVKDIELIPTAYLKNKCCYSLVDIVWLRR